MLDLVAAMEMCSVRDAGLKLQEWFSIGADSPGKSTSHDSGMLAALYVLAALGEQDRPLSELTADYQRYESSGEINFHVTDATYCVDAVLKSFGTRIQSIDHLDGVTVDLGDGTWFNLRSSNTEPLLRLNVEARTTEDVDAAVAHISAEITAQAAGPEAAP